MTEIEVDKKHVTEFDLTYADDSLISTKILISAHHCYTCVGLDGNDDCNRQDSCRCPASQQVQFLSYGY